MNKNAQWAIAQKFERKKTGLEWVTSPEMTEEYGEKDTHTLRERREERSQQRSQVTGAKKENKQICLKEVDMIRSHKWNI